MLTESLLKLVEINVSGRVLCVCRSYEIETPERIAVYRRAVGDAVMNLLESETGNLPARLNVILAEQIALLDDALARYCAGGGALESVEPAIVAPVDVDRSGTEAKAEPDEDSGRRERTQRLQGSGTVPDPKCMEEKLRDERKPIAALLQQDCVHLQLLKADRVEHWLRKLAGRTPEEGEALVLEELKANLQDQLRKYIRRHKGGPWPTPRKQNELRTDVQSARTVRSLIMLCSQLRREQQRWEKEHGKGGLVGRLFGTR